MFIGINITQTCDYIKIDCHSNVEKACEKWLTSWMHTVPMMDNCLTPLPTDQNWLKKFRATIGPSNKDDQDPLAKEMNLNYCGGVASLYGPWQPAALILHTLVLNCPNLFLAHMSIITTASITLSGISTRLAMMASILGAHPPITSYLKIRFIQSTAIVRTSFLTLNGRN
jgi:hypothetical protein